MRFFKWNVVRLVLMFALVVFLYSFSSARNQKRNLKSAVVIFTDPENIFVSKDVVNKLLIENNRNPQSIDKDKLDLNKLEKRINSHVMIEKSEVFVSIDGVLKAVVSQKTPIARVFTEDDSFYLDTEGNNMPLSDHLTARVPIVSGNIENANRAGLTRLLNMIHDDDFLKKNIIGAEILPSGAIKMMNRNYSYEIDFGKTINMERKFDNYKAFFQKAVLDSSINSYKKINLKFTQQVVCTK